MVVSNSQGSKLDPTTTEDGVGAKMGLDATIPLEADDFTFKVIQVPGADGIDLEQALDSEVVVSDILGEEEIGGEDE